MRNIAISVLTFFLVLEAGYAFGQGDSCSTAIPLTVTASDPCIPVNSTNIGATPSGVSGLPCSGVNNNDVWFTFTVPAGVTSLVGEAFGGSLPAMDFPIIYFYRGTCGTLTPLGCNTGNPPGSTARLLYSSFIPGEQIWVRVKPLGGTNDGTFQICVYNPCPAGAPANDEACGATAVPVVTSCSSYTTISNYCATHSSGLAMPACGNYVGGDVWIQAFVGANGMLEVNFQQLSMTNVACAVYTGSCSSPVSFACDDNTGSGNMPYLSLVGLPPNDTVWIRIWSEGNVESGTTGICLLNPCPMGNPPANDDPCNATIIPLATACSSFVTLSNVCASGSPGVPYPNCASYQGADVWVQTTVGTTGYLQVNFLEQTLIDVGAAIYTGNCTSLTQVACEDDGGPGNMPLLTASGLVPGTSAWIRIWDYNGGDTGTVGICMFDPCPAGTVAPPLYDNPPCPLPDSASDYIPVTSGDCTAYIYCSSLCANSVFGTSPPGVPAPSGCSPTYPPGAATGWDVWTPFIIPDTLTSGTLVINTQAGTIIDLDMAVYSLASPADSGCSIGSAYTLISCDENSGPGVMPMLQFDFGGANILQPGDTLLIRMWDYFGGPWGNWGLCISITCLNGTLPPPAFDDPPCPLTATLLPVTGGPCPAYQPGSNVCATTTTVPGNPGCANWNNAADIWYVIQMPSSGSGVIDINFQTGLDLPDLGAAVYSGLPVSCGGTGLTLLACDDDAGPGTLPFISLSNPVAGGEYFFVRVWGYGGTSIGSFGLCINDPCPVAAVERPLFDDPPCPFPDSLSNYLPVYHGQCSVPILCNSTCASQVFGNSPLGIPVPGGCSGPSYPPGAAAGWDVWIPLVVPDTPAAGFLNLGTQAGSERNIDLALYRITPPVFVNCGNGFMYNLLVCDDMGGPDSMPMISLPYGGSSVVQSGDTLLARMWKKNGGDPGGTWSLEAYVTMAQPDSICLVTVDTGTVRNKVIWEKSHRPEIIRYNIYNEVSPGIFNLVQTIDSSLQSVYSVASSNPNVQSASYAISSVDYCFNESLITRSHRTMYLAAQPHTTGGWDLTWNAYEGFAYAWFFILRGATPQNMTVVDSVPATQTTYSDTATPSGNLYYAIEVRKPGGCFPTPNPGGILYSVSHSNVAAAFPVGLMDEPTVFGIGIYPNPTYHNTAISFSLVRQENIRVAVYDIAGREIKILMQAAAMPGKYELNWDASGAENSPGVYLLRIDAGNYSDTRRIIVLKF